MKVRQIIVRSPDPRNSVRYLLGPKDSNQKWRAIPPRLFAGNPNLFLRMADTIRFKNVYTSSVLNFGPRVSERDKQLARTEYEDVMTPNMAGRIAWTWVNHEEKGKSELHALALCVDLVSGKFVPIYVGRADRRRITAWCTLRNFIHQEMDPLDPARAAILAGT